MLEAHPGISGLFVVWDTPALKAAEELRDQSIPIAIVDLGEAAALRLAQGGPIAVIAAQQPFLQGVAAAQTTILTLLGHLTPAWIALPGISVTRANVVENFQRIWRSPHRGLYYRQSAWSPERSWTVTGSTERALKGSAQVFHLDAQH